MHLSRLLAAGEMVCIASAAYSLVDDYSGNNFFKSFDFETGIDPTHGFVNYLSKPDAQNANLWDVVNGVVNMRVDSTNVVTSGRGRNSIRVSTSKTYQHALVVLDLAHMPGNACGLWPAFWMLGSGSSTWPANGEIDIIEGVNHQSRNTMTVHASGGCFLAGESCFLNKGCDIDYGDGFNNIGGGVYAIDWTSEHINVWFWPRGEAPSDVTGVNPSPIAWNTSAATFRQVQGCAIDDHFRNMQLIFDVAFCGDWAGQPAVFGADSQCQGTCQDYVRNNPQAYADSYWSINALKVYSFHDAAATLQRASSNPATAVAPTVTSAPISTTAQPYLQPLVEVMTDGNWAVGYSVGP